MKLGTGNRSLALALCAALVGAALSGCATSQKRAEQRQMARRAVSHLDIGVDHLENDRSALALREFMTAEKLDPRNPRIQYGLAQAYWARERYEDVERHLRRALALHPDYHDARLTLSALLIRLERYEEAIVECNRLVDDATAPAPWRPARDFNRDFWPATLSLAMLEAEEGHRLEAIGLYRQILEQEPGPSAESEVNYRVAEIYIALGKRDRALGHLTAAVAREPEGQWAAKSEEYLKLLR
jgi:tetratricopeptide (TPR) repeat protein